MTDSEIHRATEPGDDDARESGTHLTLDDLRSMVRAPAEILHRFIRELQEIGIDEPSTAPPVELLRAATAHRIEETCQRFQRKAKEVEAALHAALRVPAPNLYAEIKRTVEQLLALQDLAARRERLLRVWEDQSAEAILEHYAAALERSERETAEVYEAEAERVLRRRGDAAALQRFLDLREQAREARLTPAQREARADLAEVERLREQMVLESQMLVAALRGAVGTPVIPPGWRQESRLRLGAEGQAALRAIVLSDDHPGMATWLADVSPEGARLSLQQALPPESDIAVLVEPGDGEDGELPVQGQVRWCLADPRAPGRFLAGLRLLSGNGTRWTAMLSRLAQAQRTPVL